MATKDAGWFAATSSVNSGRDDLSQPPQFWSFQPAVTNAEAELSCAAIPRAAAHHAGLLLKLGELYCACSYCTLNIFAKIKAQTVIKNSIKLKNY